MSDLIPKKNTANPEGEEADQSGKAVVPHSGGGIIQEKIYPLVAQVKKIEKVTDSWIQSWNPYHPDLVSNRKLQPVQIEESKIRKVSAKYFLLAFFAFLIWASLAPIDAGVTSTGTVMVSGYRKLLQHPTGGVVQEILAKEGDRVKEGDILIRINPLKAQAELSSARLQYINTLVTEARLVAERRGSSIIIWPKDIELWKSEPRVNEAIQIQQKLFDVRRTEIVAVINGRRSQVATLTEEAKSNALLAKEGYVSQAQANQVLRSKVDAELILNQMQSAYYKDIDTQLADIQKVRDALKDRLEAVSFDRDLAAIRAPVAGVVVGLKVNTVGGTVASGQVLAEIVPDEVSLIVDAQVPPLAIDKVKVGLVADLRFSSFNQNITPVIPGTVKLVSADKIKPREGERGEEYYLVQVEASKDGLEKLGNLKILPGMPVDVIFKSGERTFLSYLLKPLTDKLAKAFKD